ncbi:MAG: squalene/phytoene synthase family protein [Pseudomonadota bacterium]
MCVQTVRAEQRPRYISLAYAPVEVRPQLCALFAFEAEIERILAIVREPMAGEIRLQWWRDALSNGDKSVPLAAALNDTVARHGLPVAAFDALLDARISDLYGDPPATLGDAEGHAGETRSIIYQMAIQIVLGAEVATNFSDRSGHAGVLAYWLDGLDGLTAGPGYRRSFVPADQLMAIGLDPQNPFVVSELEEASSQSLRTYMHEQVRRHAQAVFLNWLKLSPTERMPYLSLVPLMPSGSRPGSKALGPVRDLWKIWRAANGSLPRIG